MTTRLLAGRLALLLVSLAASSTLFAQGKDMGQAQQFYKQPNKRFKFKPGPRQKGGEIKWSLPPGGRQIFEKDEYVVLEPDVSVEYQDIKMHADKMTLNLKTKDAVAEGHVIIDQGPTRLTADHAVFNLDSKLGTFFNATGTMEPALYFTGDKLEKVSETSYRLTNGVFTSCDLDKPAWSFHMRSADITLDDYAHMKDLSFRAHDIPVFWIPRLIWPTKKDRSQGFLIPRVGFSATYGQRLELGYFIPIGDTADTTVYADLNTKGYYGAGVDVRYLPSSDVKLGEMSAYAIRNPQPVDATGLPTKDGAALEWRYQIRHVQDNLPGGFRGVVDVRDFSDLNFFRQYVGSDPTLHTLSQIYSSAYLTKNRGSYSLNILADRRDILLTSTIKQRFEQLPTVQFRVYPQQLFGSPIYFSLESSASHLRTSGLINGPEADYNRADFFPTISMQLRTPAWLSIKPQISLRETYYSSTLDANSIANPGQPLVADNQSLARFYAQGQVEVVGPSFSKVFNKSIGGFSKFKHVIEPRFRYLYTTSVNDQEKVIRFDTVDTPFLPIVRDSVEYSLTQRLIGKESGPNGSSREVLSFSLRQSVSLSKPFTTATGGTLPGQTTPPGENKFTPLTASLHVNPYQSLTFDANATFGNVSHQLDQTSISANLIGTGTRADKYLRFTYFASYKQPHQTSDLSSSQLLVNTGSSLWRDKMRADVQVNFDAKKGTFLEQRYLLGTNGSCYGLAFEYRRFLVSDPIQRTITSYAVSVTLKNVGTVSVH